MSTIAVDLDGVLAHYSGWKGDEIVGAPLPGAQEGVAELLRRGFAVVVYSTRPPSVVESWLRQNRFPVEVTVATGGKPLALAYLDDRAVRFTGDWRQALAELTVPPWWEKHPPLAQED